MITETDIISFNAAASGAKTAADISPEEVRAIAKEAFVYGFPMVDSYRIEYAYFVDETGPEFKAHWNEIRNVPRVYTPEDKAVQTPNSDTPYSFIGMDLRAEPIVLTIPEIEKNRYFSVQLIDAFTHNFEYIGTRTTGNDGGNFLIAGPNWNGEAPAGIKKIIRAETELVMGAFRTQLFNPNDLDNVKQVQAGYNARPLSEFMGEPRKSAPAIDFMKPLTPAEQRSSIEFFNILNFVLRFTPTVPSEVDLMERFSRIGVGAGRHLDVNQLPASFKQALEDGMSDGLREYEEFKRTKVDTGEVTSGDIFGTREHLKNNYLYRMAASILGIYGNSKEEAMYPTYTLDSNGNPLDGSNHAYRLRFEPGHEKPVNAFWSLTMYKLPESLLVANPLNRYLINSPMLPDLKRDEEGGVTLYIQHASPGADKEANWLPAPDGPFFMALRLYYPTEHILRGEGHLPVLEAVS
ncbi:MAG: DUF1254 domain-containing protein [Acidobacteria bacterium]|nr:DUF1254 domain-containing protein [Acidobacteriota bacterium]